MSEALQSQPLDFDEPNRLPHGGQTADGDAPSAIAATLRAAGIDAPCSLYNEAIELARQGHLGQAVARLQMLLCLDPDDADALLLLAKVHAGQGRPQEALGRLDAAVAAGAVAPVGFRDSLEAAIRVERTRDEENRIRVASREQGEMKALRAEARQLRSETIRLETELNESREGVRWWKFAAAGAGVLGAFVILGLLVRGTGGSDAPTQVTAADALPTAVADAAPNAGLPAEIDGAAFVKPGDDGAVAPVVPAAKGDGAAAKAVEPAPVKADAAPAAAPLDATATVGGKRIHVVGRDDTLYKLANRYYGDSSKWTKIRDANKATLKGGIALSLGQKLVIP
jgi:hypothetical protein